MVTVEYTLFSKNHDMIDQFDIDEDDTDPIKTMHEYLSCDIHVKDFSLDHYNDIWYGIGRDWLDEDKIDYYILCDAANTMIDTFNAIMDSMVDSKDVV